MTEKHAKKELMRRANDLSPTVHVGKDGIDEGLLNEVTNQLKKNRLLKIRVLPNAERVTSDVADEIAESTDSVVVDVRGNVVVLTDNRTWTSLCQKKF